jgi:predicted AAA+ superfamily ATPase
MRQEPVIVVEGARSVGKSTVLKEIALGIKTSIIDLDNLATRRAVAAEPDHFVSGPGPILIDEYQRVPEILDSIKNELNQDTHPGRYLLTGSVKQERLPRGTQALTGRVHRMVVSPLMQCEIENSKVDLLQKILHDSDQLSRYTRSTTERLEYANRVTIGGFPMVLARENSVQRNRWFRDYIYKTLSQDIQEISKIQQVEMFPKLLSQLAAQSSQVINTLKISRQIDLNPMTTEEYIKLLESLYIVQRIPAWGKRLNSRSTQKPKLHFIDSGLLSFLSRITPEKMISKDVTALSEFGHIFETFIVGELLRLAELRDDFVLAGHWRTHDSDEVDLVMEFQSGQVVGVEVKTGKTPNDQDFQGLKKLRDYLGNSFHAGILFYQGEHSYRQEDRVFAVPADRLWN